MRFVSIISFVIFSILVLKQVDALRQFRKNQWSIMDKIIQKKISETGSSRVSAVPGLFTQNLDHFDVTNAQTFQQRYYINDAYFKANGPVFLNIQGEGTANPYWVESSMMMEWAQKYGAIGFQLEHRFYGESHPTPNLTVQNLKYLSSEQALADLANFIQSMTAQYQLTNNKWIIFGGSYAGAMAAWLRLKYPHLAYGAVSSSGPVLAQVNFKDYYQVVARSLETSVQGTACTAAIKDATTALKAAVFSPNSLADIEKQFNLCSPLNNTNQLDVYSLFEYLAGNFAGVVQYNGFFEINLNDLCNIMTDTSLGDPLARYAAVNTLLNDYFSASCTDYAYDDFINYIQQTLWISAAARSGYRQWFYQTCNEFGYYQSSDSAEQPFGDQFPIEFLVDQCAAAYGSQFNSAAVYANADRTNSNYGGLGLQLQRTVFPNGSIDPWHALSILSNATGNVAIYIEGTAHKADMYPPLPTDSPQLTAARKQIENNLDLWLLP